MRDLSKVSVVVDSVMFVLSHLSQLVVDDLC